MARWSVLKMVCGSRAFIVPRVRALQFSRLDLPAAASPPAGEPRQGPSDVEALPVNDCETDPGASSL